MRIYRAGAQGNLRSITLLHAMARLGYEGLLLIRPAETFLSVGYFDRAPELVDLNRCRELNVPVIRRELGGGAVLLDGYQIFYQLILRRGSPLLPFRVQDAYVLFSEAVVRVYRRLGVETEYRPVNDIVTKGTGRKISGQGAGDIGGCFVFAGNVLLRFNTELMAQLFNVPEEFRKTLRRELEDNLTWVERETGRLPACEEVEDLLAEEFGRLLGLEEESDVPPEAVSLADRLREELTSHETLHEDTGRQHTLIKVREGVYVRLARGVLEGRVCSVEILVREGVIERFRLHGEVPKIDLEGLPYDRGAVGARLREAPGVSSLMAEELERLIFG